MNSYKLLLFTARGGSKYQPDGQANGNEPVDSAGGNCWDGARGRLPPKGKETINHGYGEVPVVHTINLGNIADLLYSFKESRGTRSVPDMSDTFAKKLYSTYLSYLPENQSNSIPLPCIKTREDRLPSFSKPLKEGRCQ
jgi:hypothetical protein